MRIAVNLDTNGPIEATIERAARLAERGFTNFWSSQIFGPDTLTVLALVGHELRELNLGTAVVPIQTRHPTMLAAQARTVQDAIGARLSLGVGLSHQMVVEGMWGISFDRPASYMHEYLNALAPMLRGEAVNVQGERVTAVTVGPLGPKDVDTPSLLVAALGTRMLTLAGTLADGTLLWMTGRNTVATHVAPTIRAAASAANRGEPRIVCALPIAVTNDPEGRERTNRHRLRDVRDAPELRRDARKGRRTNARGRQPHRFKGAGARPAARLGRGGRHRVFRRGLGDERRARRGARRVARLPARVLDAAAQRGSSGAVERPK